jgi:hypothetical protein
MKTMEWIRSALQQSWDYLVAPFKGVEVHFPMEDDPVGKFLDSRKQGVGLAADEVDGAPPMATDTQQALEASSENAGDGKKVAANEKSPMATDTPQALGARSEKVVVGTNVEAGAKLEESQVQSSSKEGPTGDGSTVVSPDSGDKKEIVLAKNETSEATAKEGPQAPESAGGQNTAVANPPEGKPPQDNKGKDVDSLLEIFKVEKLEEDTLSALSKELRNISVYSLLEETKEVAEKMKLKKEH